MTDHEQHRLAAYDAGLLDADDASSVAEHVAACASCADELAELRRVDAVLDALPAELFLDGPPPGDTAGVLERTVAMAHAEGSTPGEHAHHHHHHYYYPAAVLPRRGRGEWAAPGRRPLLAAAAVVIGLVVAGALGWTAGRSAYAGLNPAVLASLPWTSTPDAGAARVVAGADPATGARLGGAVVSHGSWVSVRVGVSDVTAGRALNLVVVGRDGRRFVAASWVSSGGDLIDGAAAVAPAEIGSIIVENESGDPMISVAF